MGLNQRIGKVDMKNQSDFYEYDVFISYCHADAATDGRIFDIRDRLSAANLKVKMDDRLSSTEPSFSEEIAGYIKKSERVLLFVGQNTPQSAYVDSEIKYAQLQGCEIIPALYAVPSEAKLNPLDLVPKRYRKKYVHNFLKVGNCGDDYEAEVQKLIDDLKKPIVKGELSLNFRGIPVGYEPRNHYILEMEDKLFSGENENTGVTTGCIGAFHGGPGMGKSILANLFCRDAEIRSHFPDGIMWLDVKETCGWANVLQQLRTEYPQIKNCYEESDITHEIRDFFANRRMLLVLDDVWSSTINILDFFSRIFASSGCKVLVTSRDNELIKTYTDSVVEIKELLPEEAERMMLKAEPKECADGSLNPYAALILEKCHCHTLSVAIVCAMRRDGRSWEHILKDIEHHSTQLSSKNKDYRYPSAYAAIAASVEALGTKKNDYLKLAVVPKGVSIPLRAVAVLWGMEDRDAEELALKLHNKSLINYDYDSDTLQLHDLEHDYLSIEVKDNAGFHKEFVAAYREKTGGDWVSGPDDGYFYQRIVYHMLNSRKNKDLAGKLLGNYAWIKLVIKNCGCAPILRDYHDAETTRPKNYAQVHDIGRCIFLSAQAITADYRQLPMHLVGRLMDLPKHKAFLSSIYQQENSFWLRPTARCMLPPQSNLENQWNIGAGASCIANRDDRFVVTSRGDNGRIYLFNLENNESLFTWESNALIRAVYLYDILPGESWHSWESDIVIQGASHKRAVVLTADDKGNVDCWIEGNPNPRRIFTCKEGIAFIGQLSNGEHFYVSAKGTIFQKGGNITLTHRATVTACSSYGDVLNVGYEDGYFVRFNLSSRQETVSLHAYPDMRITGIAACDAYVAIKVLLPSAVEKALGEVAIKEDDDDEVPDRIEKERAIIAVLDDFHFGSFREVFRLSTPEGGLHVMQHGSGRNDLLLYTDGIFVKAYNLKTASTEATVAINEHWVIKSICIDKRILCVDNYGHICCFDTADSFVNSFNAYDSFAMRTMVNKESFGSLEIGIRGVSVDNTDKITERTYREKKGIGPVSFCMAKTPDGIVYADNEYGVCFFSPGGKNPIFAQPKQHARARYALAYQGKPAVGFKDGTVMVYGKSRRKLMGKLYCRIPSAVDVMSTDDIYLYIASRNTVYKMNGSECLAQKVFPTRVSHMRVNDGILAVIYGDNNLVCLSTESFEPIQTCESQSDVPVQGAFVVGSDVVYKDDRGNVYSERIGDYQLVYDKSVRHNAKDRKVLCTGDKVVYCDKLPGDEFGLFVKQIGQKKRLELKRIKSSSILSILSYGDCILSTSQNDQIDIWQNIRCEKPKPLYTIDTDSILRTIDVIQGHIAFVSGSHIFWLKIENWDKM